MENTERLENRDSTVQVTENLTHDQIIEIWKYFAETGGANKERMVTIVTWIMALSGTVIGYVVTNCIEFSPSFLVKAAELKFVAVLASMGILLSMIAILIVLLCAGYANRNWEKADELAEKYNLETLKRDKSGDKPAKRDLPPNILLKFAYFLATPKNPKTSLAYVFWIFFLLAVISLSAHSFLLFKAI